MKIFINGETKNIEMNQYLTEALKTLGFNTKHSAIAINESFLPKSKWENFKLNESDRIEILSPMSGG